MRLYYRNVYEGRKGEAVCADPHQAQVSRSTDPEDVWLGVELITSQGVVVFFWPAGMAKV